MIGLMAASSFASSLSTKLKGYSEDVKDVLEWRAPVRRYLVTPKEILVLFGGHDAFCSFPLRKEDQSEVKSFLEKMIRSGSQDVRVRLNPANVHILTLETP